MIICLEANWIGSKNNIIGSKNYIIASKPIFLYVRIPDLNRPDPYLKNINKYNKKRKYRKYWEHIRKKTFNKQLKTNNNKK